MTPELASSADPHKEQLLDRYLAGEATEAEGVYVRSWLSRYPAEAAALDAIVHRLAGATSGDVDASLARLRLSFERSASAERSVWGVGQRPWGREGKEQTLRLGASTGRTMQWGGFKAQPLRRWVWYPVAGLVLGAVFVIAGWTLDATSIRRWFAGTNTRYTTYATAPGQRATITLPDGNTVVLNVASRLEVPVDYGTDDYVVRLPIGEALFTVSHHAGTSFTVVSGTTTTRVLGTRFMVRHYLTDTTVTVAVQHGKVAVGNAVVTAQRLIEVGRTGPLRERPADQGAFAFAAGILALPQMRLSDAIPDLDRWYNGEIRLADPTLGNQELAGKFTAGSLADLAEFLTVATGGRVVRDGRVLTLYARTAK